MIRYSAGPDIERSLSTDIGVLLTNLGTPEAPTAAALRPYLKEFLGDPRVIEEPGWKWRPILNLFILPFRPRQSAALYRKVWTPEGSPLLNISDQLRSSLQSELRDRFSTGALHVTLGMRYGQPSVASALQQLRDRGCGRLVVLPLFPQYSGTTTGSTFDAVAAELTRWRAVPDLRTIHRYHKEPLYIKALAASIRERWEADGMPEKLLFSFHGIPLRYYTGGDPYPLQCQETARLVAAELGLEDSQYQVSFQSVFGREQWVKPPTDGTVRDLAESGVRSLDVICPGFSADCLETIEEIDQLNREIFEEAGGEQFRYIPCLNAREDHVALLTELVAKNIAGWSDDIA